MSVYDGFRALTSDLLSAFDAVPATISRTSEGTITKAMRARGQAGFKTTVQIPCRVIMGKRRTRLINNTISIDITATTDHEIKRGDRLTVGGKTYEVIDVEDRNPDGGVPIIYVATLR